MTSKNTYAPGRFGLTIDGETAGFSKLDFDSGGEKAHRKTTGLLANELTHVVLQNSNNNSVTVRIAGLDSAFGSSRKLQYSVGKRVRIKALNQQGTPISGFEGVVVSATRNAMQSEWELVYESIQRVV